MDEVRYVCEPHYDDNGNFDYWSPLFPYKRDNCEGCLVDSDMGKNGEWCEMCSRCHPDLYVYKIEVD